MHRLRYVCPVVPQDALTMSEDDLALIDSGRCIGCGGMSGHVSLDAVKYDWGATYEELQRKVVEHAMGVSSLFQGKALYVNVLTRISKDCDCMGHTFEKMARISASCYPLIR